MNRPGKDLSNELQPYEAKLSLFSDGSDAALRHAPRKKRLTGEKLAVSCVHPAKIPESWSRKTLNIAGVKKKVKKAEAEDLIPSFASWRKNKRKHKAKLVSVRPATLEQVKGIDRPIDWSLLHMAGAVKEKKTQEVKMNEMTPAPGDMTPAPEGETPGLPPAETPHMPGVETPGFGQETPLPGGEDTPGVPTLPPVEVGSKEENTPIPGMGDQTPIVIPTLPGRGDLKNKIKVEGATPMTGQETPFPGEETPRVPHTMPDTEEGQQTPIPGEETPGVPRTEEREGETPMMPPGMETPLMPPPGMDTPLMPPSRTGPPVVPEPPTTPRRGGSASAIVELTPGWDEERRPSGGSHVQQASLKRPDAVAEL